VLAAPWRKLTRRWELGGKLSRGDVPEVGDVSVLVFVAGGSDACKLNWYPSTGSDTGAVVWTADLRGSPFAVDMLPAVNVCALAVLPSVDHGMALRLWIPCMCTLGSPPSEPSGRMSGKSAERVGSYCEGEL